MWFTGPENDYRPLLDRAPDSSSLTVAVCLPVYNRTSLLMRTVAALVAQSYPQASYRIIIGDDGSEEDVPAAVAAFRDDVPIEVIRRERDGYGAGQARNMAAAQADADVLVFIDADCLPDPDLVLRHAQWHQRADNLVVIGSRHGLDTSTVDIPSLAAGDVDLRQLAFGTSTPTNSDYAPTDHRRILHRRTADQRHGDEAFRSLVSSNFSIRRDRFFEIGGFDETFHRWGGEDVELGWRCQQAGYFIVPENSAVCYHQLQEDLWDEGGRDASKDANDWVIQNKIPHRFYRKRHIKDHIWEIPKVSVIAHPASAERREELRNGLRRQTWSDWELIFLGADTADFSERMSGDPRYLAVVSDDPLDAIDAARGEFIVFVNGAATFEQRAIAHLVRRLDGKPRTAVATSTYAVVDEVVRDATDIARLDAAWDTVDIGLPVVSATRRRAWVKAAHGADSIETAWHQLIATETETRLRDPVISLPAWSPGEATTDAGAPSFTNATTRLHIDLPGSRVSPETARAYLRYLREPGVVMDQPRPERAAEPVTPDSEVESAALGGGSVGVRYVGWTGHDNFGDEVLLGAVTDALSPWAAVQTSGQAELLLLGGGTLINRGSYIGWLEDQDSPRIERAVFGTGVANPEFWTDRDESGRWVEWLRTCCLVGVRGPMSANILSSWGVEAEVIGDAALLYEPVAPRVDGRVVISPCRTRDELWGGSDAAVVDRLADLARELEAQGHDVQLFSAHPDDDGPCIDIMRAANLAHLPHHRGYLDSAAAMEFLASADLVVAERLHAAVLAAAAGVPFVALEYRPKVRDFARSVGMDALTLRTDALDGLGELVASALADRQKLVEVLQPAVSGYRKTLRGAADRLRSVMEG